MVTAWGRVPGDCHPPEPKPVTQSPYPLPQTGKPQTLTAKALTAYPRPLPQTPYPQAQSPKVRPHWRFEDLEIWQRACQLAVDFHQLAEHLNERRLYRYSEQLRAAGLSLSNNIAEGSGSSHPREFIQFLNIARRSLFENVSMLLVFEKLGVLASQQVDKLLTDCDALSRKLTAFTHFLNQKKQTAQKGKG